jgi:hypothetical protein
MSPANDDGAFITPVIERFALPGCFDHRELLLAFFCLEKKIRARFRPVAMAIPSSAPWSKSSFAISTAFRRSFIGWFLYEGG